MDELQVLVATVGRQDLSLTDTMHIRCGAVIANQADREEIVTEHRPTGDVKMITTMTRGVGLNRNIALLAAESDLVLFADDDVVYYDGMEEAVVRAFRENPQADVLIFSMDILRDGKVAEQRHLPLKRRHLWNSLRFGTYTIAARRRLLVRNNIMFHRCFGGGCPYSSGEDSLFLKYCFEKKLRVWSHPYVLGTCSKDESSWFTGYHEKYFYDKGALVGKLFPRSARLMAFYFAFRFKRRTDVKPLRRLKLIWAGIRGGRTLAPYREGI